MKVRVGPFSFIWFAKLLLKSSQLRFGNAVATIDARVSADAPIALILPTHSAAEAATTVMSAHLSVLRNKTAIVNDSKTTVSSGVIRDIPADPNLRTLLGMAIKGERSALRISQEELAHRARLHRTYVSDVERGARNPSIESIEKLARALDVSVAALFDRANHGSLDRQSIEILLAEDNPREVQLTLEAFEKANLTNRVYVVRDGVEALDFIFARGRYLSRRNFQSPRIVLLDLDLPNKKGLEVLRQIKANETTSDILVIILADLNGDCRIIECRRLGAAAQITKPLNFQNFCDAVAGLDLGWTLARSETGKV